MKYAGSKLKLLPYILDLVGQTPARTVLDGFAGTTRVSQALAKQGYRVICNDIAVWTKVFGTCYLQSPKQAHEYQPLIDHLNAVKPVSGWFTEHYGGHYNDGSSVQSDGLKKPWQIHNTQKLDGIRQEIEKLSLSEADKAVALTSLILALDRVDSTLGHYVSYLKRWSARSSKELSLSVPKLDPSEIDHVVSHGDIFDLVPEVSADLAYYDPPYGSNNEKMPPSRVRYASYYHLWTTICLQDEPPLFGKAKRRSDSSDRVAVSAFEEFRKDERGRFIAVDAIDRLLRATTAQWIILSYSSGGRATAKELTEVLNENGKLINTLQIDHKKNVMAYMKWTNEWSATTAQTNHEFLFLLEKR